MENEVKELKEKIAAMEKAAVIPSQDETGFVHTVFFWMNENVTDEEKANFAKNGLGELVKVSSIYKSYFGPPAKTPREVVDNSYDFALICHFKNKEDQDAYQIDPIHLKFIEDYKDLWKKVIVYDNLTGK
jgi:hypothetical protein